MNFNNTFPEWGQEGTPPSTTLKTEGFKGGYKPPASVFNWFWCKVMKALTELQTKLSNVDLTKANKSNSSGGGELGTTKGAPTGGAIGHNSLETGGGFAGGEGATASYGGSVGKRAISKNGGGALGLDAKADYGGAVGYNANAEKGGAVGYGAKAGAGFAGGYNAEIGQTDQGYVDAIQLGTGLNQIVGSLQVYDYTLMDYFGKIPFARLPITVSAMQTYQFTSGYSAKVEYNFGSDTKFAIVKIGDCVKDDTQETVSVTATAMTGVIDPGPCIMFSRGAGVASDAALTVYYYVIEFK